MSVSWKKNKNRKAIAILRVSSKRQEGNHSHELQEEKVSKYCKEHSLELEETRKIVESAKCSDERKKYAEAIKYALKNNIFHVLFYMNDREARNLTDNEKNEQLVLAGKIVIHYVNDNKVLEQDSPISDFFMRDIGAVMNKNFSRVLSVKVNDVMRKKAEDGWFPGNRPTLGYMHQKMKDSSGREMKRGTIIVPDSDKRKVRQVQREFELRANGYTLEQIRDKILEEGLLEPAKLRAYSVHGIEERLKNKFYWGYFDWQGIEYKAKHELIIDRHTLDRVKASFGLKGSRRRAAEEKGVFSGGWLRCGENDCGLQIVYDPKTKKIKSTGETKEYAYYRCSDSRKQHPKLTYASETKIWDQFSGAAESVHLDNDVAERIFKALDEVAEKAKIAVQRDIKNFQIALDQLEVKRNQLFDLFLAKTISEEEYRRQSNRITEEHRYNTTLLEKSQIAISDAWKVTAQKVLELATRAKTLWNSGSDQQRLEYLRTVCSNPVLDGATVRYDLKKPYSTVAEMRQKEDWRPQGDLNPCIHRERVVS